MEDTEFIKDLPSGPLDQYRKRATFYWKQMKVFFEDPHSLKIKMHVWETLAKDPLFERLPVRTTSEEMKRTSALRYQKVLQYKFISPEMASLPYMTMMRHTTVVYEALTETFREIGVKIVMGNGVFRNVLRNLGTERHEQFLKASWEDKVFACLALTEFSHGSNAKSIRTTATFDEKTQQFVLNCPDFASGKCWIGNLGKTCTVALVFAQLYTKNECHGLHIFVVPIRDPKTLLPYPGIILGDMGEKIGIHGVDNGFMFFKNYRVSRESLLNRFSDVTPDGTYESNILDERRVLAATLESLSAARIGIIIENSDGLACAATIAIRYAALRKQFAIEDGGEEVPLIEYQLHQWRLFPYVAAASILKTFAYKWRDEFLSLLDRTLNSNDSIEELNSVAAEIHAVISCTKPLITWTCRDGIQESREACGGHGFLMAAGFGELREWNDPTVTYEGDNNVLKQQTVNFLLRQWDRAKRGEEVHSPLKTCDFLNSHREIKQDGGLENLKMDDILQISFVERCYLWLVVYLIERTHEKQSELLNSGKSLIEARNYSKVYRASVLGQVFAEFFVLRHFWSHSQDSLPSLQPVLTQLSLLYGLWSLEKHSKYFYQGGFTRNPNFSALLQDGALKLCADLKDNILAVTDAVAPPDFVLNSVLGKSDGRLYENLENLVMHNPGAMSRPDWWKEIIVPDAPDFKQLKCKM